MTDLYSEALDTFETLYNEATGAAGNEPTAMTLATVDEAGRPAIRTVLLKSFGLEGFTFYTNTRSPKGRHLARTPHAALCFFWPALMRQVTVRGSAALVPDAEADAYWATRDRDSQLGAWASAQSEPLARREALLARVQDHRARFAGQIVPRPAHWSGYCVAPYAIEFWRAGEHRLNERVLYFRDGDAWRKALLNP